MTGTDIRTEATLRALEAAVAEAGMFVSGDRRVGEADAGALLGYASNYMRQLRAERKGPPAYALGLNGCRVSYRLVDLAEWIESRRDFFDE